MAKVTGPSLAVRPATLAYSACRGRPASMIGPASFLFLGQNGSLDGHGRWNDPQRSKLWLYNLHYFDDLLAVGAGERAAWHRSLIARWIADNPAPGGNGWEPYVLSRRIVNWIGWHLAGNALDREALASLAMQGRALSQLLEYHLLGNHLFANAKALVFLGSFFEGKQADLWRERGLSILASQLDEQILADGGHFELSPMYHALTLEDLLDLNQLSLIYPDVLTDAAASQTWERRALAMLDWLETMTHPDGEFSFFNDAALGQTRNHHELRSYFASMATLPEYREVASGHLAQSGYARLQRGQWLVLMDMAEVGPSYLPGHAHADTLSLEISIGRSRLVTNSGTSVYAPGPVRDAERGTASHATVCIDGENSSETWASFRVGRRAHVLDPQVLLGPDADVAQASHNGYRYLKGAPRHHRRVEVSASKVVVSDRYEAAARHEVIGRFPLHPSVRSVTVSRNGWEIVTGEGQKVKASISGAVQSSIEEGSYGESFGARLPRPVLVWTARDVLSLDVKLEFSA